MFALNTQIKRTQKPFLFLDNFSELLDIKNVEWDEILYPTARQVGKTKSVSIGSMVLACLIYPNVHSFAFRKFATGINGTIKEEIENAIKKVSNAIGQEISFGYNYTFRKFTFSNGNTIQLKSLYVSMSDKTPLAGLTVPQPCELTVAWLEEASEFSLGDISLIKLALRDAEIIKVISTCNPHHLANPFIAYANNKFPYDLERIKKEKFISKMVEDEDTGYKTKIVWASIYSNTLLPKETLKRIETNAKLDDSNVEVVIWGKPGVPEGNVYNINKNVIVDIEDVKNEVIEEFVVGIDYGIKDPTTASLIMFNQDYKDEFIIDEYYHQNKKGLKAMTMEDYSETLINTINMWYEKYTINLYQTSITIAVEYSTKRSISDMSLIDILTFKANEKGYYHLHFIKARKNDILDRIIYTNNLIGENRFHIVKDCVNHIREYTSSFWIRKFNERTKEEVYTRSSNDDHTINSSEYGMNIRFKSIFI